MTLFAPGRQGEIQRIYARVCRDSGFRFPIDRAVHFAADLLGISALQVWIALGLDDMEAIASGEHPCTKERL